MRFRAPLRAIAIVAALFCSAVRPAPSSAGAPDTTSATAHPAHPAWPRVADVRISVTGAGSGLLTADDLRPSWRALIGRDADPSRLAAVADEVLARCASDGRLDAACRLRLEPAGAGAAVLVVAVDEGRITPLGDVPIEGAGAIPERDARRVLGLSSGEPFDPDRFVAGVDELLARYEARGFPFARVAPRDFRADSTLDFRVVLDEGKGGRVLGLALTGNANTRASYVAREMLLRPGRPWDRRALERGRDRLLRTGLFRTVSEPYPLVDESAGGLRVGLAVEEVPANRIEGVFGWNRGEASAGGFFSGYLDVLFKNLGGVGRRAAVRWERRGRDAREIHIGYQEPWLPLIPAGVTFDLLRTFRDSTYVRTQAEGTLDVPVSAALTFSAHGAADSWGPGDRAVAVVPKSRRARGGLGFRYEGTDFPSNPSRGMNLSLTADYGEKTVDVVRSGGDSSATAGATTRVRYREAVGHAAIEAFVPLGGPHLIAMKAHGDVVASDEEPVPEYEMFFLGGARSLRGYDEDRFLGEKVAVATLEYRFRLAGRARLFAFVDQGYYFLRRQRQADAAGLESVHGTPLGWGGGIQAESRLGVVGIGVGIPKGEGLSAARVHVSLEQEF